MKRIAILAMVTAAISCGGNQVEAEHPVANMQSFLPSTLEAPRPKTT